MLTNKIETKEQLEERLKKHDWYFEYCDDHSKWSKGNADLKQINKALNELCEEQEAKDLYNKYCPKDFRRE